MPYFRSFFASTCLGFSIIFPNVLGAQNLSSEIESLCPVTPTRSDEGELGRAIQEVNDNLRESGPMSFEAELEHFGSIIEKTSFSWLLDCRSEAENRGFNYVVEERTDGGWAFSYRREKNEVVLKGFDVGNLHYGITTYAHELLHLCQFLDVDRTQIRDIGPNLSGTESVRRAELRLLGEVEAFKLMFDIYLETLRSSSVMCRLPSSGGVVEGFYQQYVNVAEKLENGTFANGVVQSYIINERSYPSRAINYLVRQNEGQYVYHEDQESFYRSRPLRPRLVQAIEVLGFSHSEDFPWPYHYGKDATRHIRHALTLANCSPVPEGAWTGTDSRALENLANVAGITLETSDDTLDNLLIIWNLVGSGSHKCG